MYNVIMMYIYFKSGNIPVAGNAFMAMGTKNFNLE